MNIEKKIKNTYFKEHLRTTASTSHNYPACNPVKTEKTGGTTEVTRLPKLPKFKETKSPISQFINLWFGPRLRLQFNLLRKIFI